MKRLCAWCKSEIEDDNNPGKQLSDEEYIEASEEATHGMCEKCFEEMTR